MNNIIDDLALLTNIPKSFLHKLSSNCTKIIAHAVFEEIQVKNTIVKLDIGIGILCILISKDEIQYKFIPSKELEKCVSNTIDLNKDLLTIEIEDNLKNKILNTYKEFM